MKKNILIVVVLLLSVGISIADGLFYQWVDANGVKHFSNAPQPDKVKAVIRPKITYEQKYTVDEEFIRNKRERERQNEQINSQRAYKRQQQIFSNIKANQEHQNKMADIEKRQHNTYQQQEKIDNFQKSRRELESEISKFNNTQLDRETNKILNNELKTMERESPSQTESRRIEQRARMKEWEADKKQRNMEWEEQSNRSKQREIESKIDELERGLNRLRSY